MDATTHKERVRAELLRWKRDIEKRLSDTGHYGLDDAMKDELSELSVVDNHPADVASELFEREKDLGLKHMDETRLQDVQGALEALENGTYGTCIECSRAISSSRLEANPLARRCIDCKRTEETRWSDLDRPIEEQFLAPGFGRSNLDANDYTGFDGEDSWQAVARYNQRPGYENEYDYGVNDEYMDDNEGIVDSIDVISNEEYRNQQP